MKHTQTEQFLSLLREFDTAVLVTHGQQPHFRCRPMMIARVDDNGDLWFVTNEDSAKVHEIEADTRVLVVCQRRALSCVTINGRASLTQDQTIIRELWKTSYQVWFPQGVNDPHIILIHVRGEEGEYWDNTGLNRLTYLYRAVKAVIQKTVPEVTEGEQHGRVIRSAGGFKH